MVCAHIYAMIYLFKLIFEVFMKTDLQIQQKIILHTFSSYGCDIFGRNDSFLQDVTIIFNKLSDFENVSDFVSIIISELVKAIFDDDNLFEYRQHTTVYLNTSAYSVYVVSKKHSFKII